MVPHRAGPNEREIMIEGKLRSIEEALIENNPVKAYRILQNLKERLDTKW